MSEGSACGFGPTLVAGVGGSALTALAGVRDWATATGEAAGIRVDSAVSGSESAPLAAALALVGLTAWGVLLVLRGTARRVVALLGAVASAGVLVAVLAVFGEVRSDALDALLGQSGSRGDPAAATLTGWYLAAGLGAAVSGLAFAVAVWASPRWPAMGSRYDAPGSREPEADEDMWRAIDRGHDPTS